MLSILLAAVLLLTNEDDVRNVELEKLFSLTADAGYEQLETNTAEDHVESARVRSERSDFDRNEGVLFFSGKVFVEYAKEATLNADNVYVFFSSSNKLSRVVATGNVAFTNDTVNGACETAVFRMKSNKLEMYAGKHLKEAVINDGSSTVMGSKISVWLDTEQVEVENMSIITEVGEGDISL